MIQLNLRCKEIIKFGNSSMCILVHISIQHPVSCRESPTPVVDLPVSTTIGSSVDRVTVEILAWSNIFSAWSIWTCCQHKGLRIDDCSFSILILLVDPVDLIDITRYRHTGTVHVLRMAPRSSRWYSSSAILLFCLEFKRRSWTVSRVNFMLRHSYSVCRKPLNKHATTTHALNIIMTLNTAISNVILQIQGCPQMQMYPRVIRL